MRTIDRLHTWATSQPVLRVFTLLTRVLLALAFVPSGLVKILDHPFTTLPATDPVGHFFDGFFSVHLYYRFVGVAQWVAGALLLVPRTAALGAALYLPIILNIFVITVGIGPAFAGTRVVTGAMLLADLYLLLWDWDRWKTLLPTRPATARHGNAAVSMAMLVAAAVGLQGVTNAHLALIRHESFRGALALIILGAVLGLLTMFIALKRAQRS